MSGSVWRLWRYDESAPFENGLHVGWIRGPVVLFAWGTRAKGNLGAVRLRIRRYGVLLSTWRKGDWTYWLPLKRRSIA